MQYPEPIAKLIESFSKLPGIGQKNATRLAFYTLGMSDEDIEFFAESLDKVKKDITFCEICGNITDRSTNPCVICADTSRDQTTLMIVETSRDLMAIENTQGYRGLYHVLNGVLSPSEGKGPENINLTSLFTRLREHEEITEVIIATNADTEGEATAMYIARFIKQAQIKVTRIATGLSVGGDIDYADGRTISRAVEGRREL
jgi:recombination protein RecR